MFDFPSLRRQVGVTVLPRGEVLYTGQTAPPSAGPIYATPSRSYAETYARSKPGGKVYMLFVTSALALVQKRDARSSARPTGQRGEWEGFGQSGPDYSVARLLCGRTAKPSHTLHGVDGWVHEFRSRHVSEVLLCSLDKVRVVGRGREARPVG